MEFEDRIVIATPEGVDLELTLAGLGSRFLAQVLDLLIQLFVGGALVGALLLLGLYGVAVAAIVVFCLLFLYHPLFELAASGRTPGKRWTGLRVVLQSGGPVGVRASAVRNVLRIADFLPVAYLAGAVSILVTERNQRLGDLAGSTVVVRERRSPPATVWRPVPAGVGEASSWDLSGVSASELAAVRLFLARRHDLPASTRHHHAERLARQLSPKVAGAPQGLASEAFLETVAAEKAARGG